ncbi:hypothetical protein [Chryseobacterium potabilaquae]|uniref:Uncharacterized protein n=1 Tax=Chryseobacterium potabilaquae TaxID=2675057 RepID=A0A6N4X6B2_9FLAO|nr:hypothetical protein [Chryseobacterium potabilaquae]CAA7193822.1 hypothetical protein CHRY9293_00233 [Chryseobacterium potabilaquae]
MFCNTGRTRDGISSRISKAFMFSIIITPNNYFVAGRDGSWSGVAIQYRL